MDSMERRVGFSRAASSPKLLLGPHPLSSPPFLRKRQGCWGLRLQNGLAELCDLVINGQEKGFHYAGMSGEGVGKELPPLPAPASPAAAMIDVSYTTAVSLAEGAPTLHTPPGARPAARCSCPLGELERGQGRQAVGLGSCPDLAFLALELGALGSAVDFWLVVSLDHEHFQIQGGVVHTHCPAGET